MDELQGEETGRNVAAREERDDWIPDAIPLAWESFLYGRSSVLRTLGG